MIDADKLTPFLPPLDKMTFWRVLMGLSAFSFWVFLAWFAFSLYPKIAKSESVNDLRMEQKEERIIGRHRDFCRAPQGSMQADYFLQRRNELMREYEQIDGQRFDPVKLPPCEILRAPEFDPDE